MRVGERRLNLMRAFNAREGFYHRQDVLPRKFFRTLGGVQVTGCRCGIG